MDNITKYYDFKHNVEKKIKIVGKIAKAIWQHLTTFINSHPYMNYFDLDDGHQIVIYTKDSISCEEKIEMIGKLIKIESMHKNPRYKISEKYFEYQLIADSWNFIEND